MSIDPLEVNLYKMRRAIQALRERNHLEDENSQKVLSSLGLSDRKVEVLEGSNLNGIFPDELYHRTLARSVGTHFDKKEPKGPESYPSKPRPHNDKLIPSSRDEPDTKDQGSEDKLSNTGRLAEARLQCPEEASPGLHRFSGTVPQLEPGIRTLGGFHQSKILNQVGAAIVTAIRNLFRRPPR